MNLLDRYINDLGEKLPAKNREDIQKETRSILEDMIDERAEAENKPADEQLVREVLLAFGSPKKTAAAYQSGQYVIGPNLYPLFKKVLRIVLIFSLISALIGVVSNLSSKIESVGGLSDQSLNALINTTTNLSILVITEIVGTVVSGLFSGFGICTLVFWILDRTLPAKEFQKEEDWDPDKLPKSFDKDKIDAADQIVEIIFTVLGLIALNYFPQIFSIFTFENGILTSERFLSDAFFSYVPFITIKGIFGIALCAYLLSLKHWNTLGRILTIVLDMVTLILMIVMMSGPSLISSTTDWSLLGDPELVELMPKLINILPIAVLSIVVIGVLINIIKNGMKLASKKLA